MLILGKSFHPSGPSFSIYKAKQRFALSPFQKLCNFLFCLPFFSQNTHIFILGKFLIAVGLSLLFDEMRRWILWGPFNLFIIECDGVIFHANIGSWGICLFFSSILFCFSFHLQLFLNVPLVFFLLPGVHHRFSPERANRVSFECRPPVSKEQLYNWAGVWPGANLWGPFTLFPCP